jgi:hypothetical protein
MAKQDGPRAIQKKKTRPSQLRKRKAMQKMEEKSMWLCEEARGNKRIKNKGVGHGWKLGLTKKKV